MQKKNPKDCTSQNINISINIVFVENMKCIPSVVSLIESSFEVCWLCQ